MHVDLTTIKAIEERVRIRIERPSAPEKDSTDDLCDYLSSTANIISRVVYGEINAACSVSIKVLYRSDDEPIILTFCRDSFSQRERSNSPERFSYANNAAFATIINNPEVGCFGSNDLLTLSIKQEYSNTNERWKQLYNSTAVVSVSGARGGLPIGFLCVDSWNGKVASDRVKEILFQFADHIYTGFQLICAHEARLRRRDSRDIVDCGRFVLEWQRIDDCLTPVTPSTQELLEQGMSRLCTRQREQTGNARTTRGPGEYSGSTSRPLSDTEGVTDMEYDPSDVVAKGEVLYSENRVCLESNHFGKCVLLNVENGKYVIGDDPHDVMEKFDSEYGRDAPGYLKAIGFDFHA